MSKEEILAEYYGLDLTDKLLVATAILYDLDVGDFSTVDRNECWSDGFGDLIDCIEDYLSQNILNDIQHKLEFEAKQIMKNKAGE